MTSIMKYSKAVRALALLPAALIFSVLVLAQSPPQNWFHLDPVTDGYLGVSSIKAYNELLRGRVGQPVVVAVIDGGTDINHEDLKEKIWTNKREVPGNGLDDDGNGYVDDLHGWNFIGGKKGNVRYDTFEITRLYKSLNDKYGKINPAEVPPAERDAYNRYLAIRNDYEEKSRESRYNYALYSGILQSINYMLADLGSGNPTLEQVEAYEPESDSSFITQQMLIAILREGASIPEVMDELEDGVESVESGALYHYNPDFDPRSIVGDNYEDDADRYYGNADVVGPDAVHGTHVAGIIGADRTNAIGVNGIADHVELMILRVVPDGDERDKDVANSIRYAADNGARVVNMSFGKSYGYDKAAVDEAIRYAESRDVLLVHASGNDGLNNDRHQRFPSDNLSDGSTPGNWLEVGASSYDYDVARFSNYGKKNVDVWAPGVAMYATVPGDKYRNLQGTSMAAPVASGIAALIRSYFPELTAAEVKEILKKSVVRVPGKVSLPGDESAKMVKLKKISVSGGVVNAYHAIELAIRQSEK